MQKIWVGSVKMGLFKHVLNVLNVLYDLLKVCLDDGSNIRSTGGILR